MFIHAIGKVVKNGQRSAKMENYPLDCGKGPETVTK